MTKEKTSRTYEQINAGAKKLRQRYLNQEKKGIMRRTLGRLKESTAGKVLYASVMVGSLIGVSEYHGALNAEDVQDTANKVSYHVESVIKHNKETITDFVDRISDSKGAQDLENGMGHLGKILYSKKQAYEDVLKKNPDNKKMQLELQRLEGVINTYEQNLNQNKQEDVQ